MTPNPEDLLDQAIGALACGPGRNAVLDELPVPIYTTDATGAVTYWNRACVAFAGRVPRLGRDKWCVTWQLYTLEGEPLPHDQCPMAQAIQEKRAIRNAIAIAERPDGSRAAFRPYPTPLFAEDGSLAGAVNMLIDVSKEQSAALQAQSDRCRLLAESSRDRWTSKVLIDMAEAHARTARELASKRIS
jgi:PAS domain-containing protein